MLLIYILSLYLLFTMVLSIYWAVHIRALNGSMFSCAAMFLCIAICFYIFGYTLELNSSIQSQMLFWNNMEYIGIPYVSALWLTTGFMYTGSFMRHKKLLFALLFIIPILTMILRMTNDYHHLYFASNDFVKINGMLFFIKKPGPWMYVQTVHSMLMIFVAMGLFIFDSIKSEDKQIGKILLITAASIIAAMGLILSIIKPFGLPIDYMACCLPITCMIVILAIAHYDLLETQAVARNKVFQASKDAILLISRKNKILDYNTSAARLFIQTNVRLSNGYLDALFREAPDVLSGLKTFEKSVIKVRSNAETRYFDITTECADDCRAPKCWIKTIHDVTEIYRLNGELKRQALTDELSGLNNRRSFMEIAPKRILEAHRHNENLYFIMMDLDHFKNINDQYGHLAGDFVIREFSQMLKEHFGTDRLTARLGGEEFAVLYLDLGDKNMLADMNDFLTRTKQHTYNYNNNPLTVTVSIGITKVRPDQTVENMIRMADKALYASKRRGRSQITCSE